MALATNLVSYWKLDESSGNASDSVGSNTLTNTGTATYSAGKINNGVDFSATTKYLGTGSATGLPTGTVAFTMACWVNFTNFSTARYFFGFGAAANNQLLTIRCDSSTSWVIDDNGVGTAFPAVSSMSTGVWYHIVYTYPGSGNIYTAYLNGVSIGTANNTRTPNIGSGLVSMGSNKNTSASENLVGSMDEAGIWSRALTADEVSQLFNSGRGNAYPLTDSPSLYGGISYFKLDESSGNASDSVGSNTLTNTSTTYAAGKINNGAVFDGSTSKLIKTSASGVSRTGTDEVSVSVWVNPSRTSGQYQELVCNRDGTLNWSLYMHTTAGEISFHGSAQNKGTYVPTTSVWTHIVATVDSSSNLKLYANGVLKDTIASYAYGSTTTAIGVGQISNGGEALLGSLDEAGIWSRALTSTEVTALYNSGAGLAYPWAASSTLYRDNLMMMGV